MKIININHGSPEWLEWRRSGVGASDIAAIMGRCPFRSRTDVMRDKCGLWQQERNIAMEKGLFYEDEARSAFEELHRGMQYPPLMIEHDSVPYHIASLDGYCSFTRDILEIKVPGIKTLSLAKNGIVPEHYIYQIQWQLYVSGSLRCYYWAYDRITKEGHKVLIYRDEEIIDKLKASAEDFWSDFLDGNVLEQNPMKQIDDDYLFTNMALHKLRIKKAEKEYKRLMDLFEEKYPNETCSLENSKYIMQRSERSNIDYKQAAMDHCANLEKYRKPKTVTWTLKVK
jgi:putative phage-type endonuclease